jgi:hypothetical protein
MKIKTKKARIVMHAFAIANGSQMHTATPTLATGLTGTNLHGRHYRLEPSLGRKNYIARHPPWRLHVHYIYSMPQTTALNAACEDRSRSVYYNHDLSKATYNI